MSSADSKREQIRTTAKGKHVQAADQIQAVLRHMIMSTATKVVRCMVK